MRKLGGERGSWITRKEPSTIHTGIGFQPSVWCQPELRPLAGLAPLPSPGTGALRFPESRYGLVKSRCSVIPQRVVRPAVVEHLNGTSDGKQEPGSRKRKGPPPGPASKSRGGGERPLLRRLKGRLYEGVPSEGANTMRCCRDSHPRIPIRRSANRDPGRSRRNSAQPSGPAGIERLGRNAGPMR